MPRFIPIFFTLALLLAFAPSTPAQPRVEINRTANNGSRAEANGVRYRYLFENERFTTPVQELEFDGAGQGKFRFQRKGNDEIVNDLSVSSAVLTQIQSLLDELNFLASNEEYQHKKDFSHLGTMTITYARGGRERTVKFNYTDNPSLNKLAEIFRNLATQETRVFELEVVRATDSLSTPAQLRFLESEMRGKRIADPQRFVPILEELKLDESIPLIARNHAERLLQMIKKGK